MRYSRIAELADVGDLTTLYDCLRLFGEEIGFEYTGINAIQYRPGKERIAVFRSNPPSGFAEAAREPCNVRRDSVMNRLTASPLPVIYDQSTYVSDGCGDLWEEQAIHGYKTGIAVTMNAYGGKQFMLGFDREERLPADESKVCRMLGDLQLLAVHALEPGLRMLLPPTQETTLTEKQRDVLLWMAEGKTAWETGQILGITQRGVTAHLTAIFQKLDVRSKAQAVSKAMGMGLI